MSRRFVAIVLEIAAIACGIPLGLSIRVGSLLWFILSCALAAGFLIALSTVSRCPHCNRIISLTYLTRSHIYCHLCGGKVDLDEDILHRKE